MIQYTLERMSELESLMMEEKLVQMQAGTDSLQQQQQQQFSVASQNLPLSTQKFIEHFCEADLEAEQLVKRIMKISQMSIEDIVQIKEGDKKLYLSENQKVITQVYQSKKREEMLSALHKLQDRVLNYQNKFKSKTLRICFSSQQEIFSIFLKVFGNEIFSIIAARKILEEIWQTCILFRDTSKAEHNLYINAHFFFKLELYCNGRAMFDCHRSEFPLHKAVFENNLPLISRLINCTSDGHFFQNKNELDACGNTPLILAVKLGYVDVVKVLSDWFTCPKLKPFSNYPCALDIASALKNKEILKVLLEANQKIKQHYLDMHKEEIFRALESLPDFRIDMHFNCKSNFIPFLKNITPSDTYKIYKQGSKIRLDMTLVGFRKLKCVRGNLSVLFKGRGQQNEGDLYVVDHDIKSVSNIFNDIAQTKIDKDLEDIMNEQQYQKLYKADKFKIDPVLDKRGDTQQKVLEGYHAEKYEVKTTFLMTQFKINMSEMQSLQKFQTFEQYIQNNQINFFFKQKPSNEDHSFPATIQSELDKESWFAGWTHKQATSPKIETEAEQALTSNTAMYSTTNKKTSKKQIKASIWLSKSHPISLDSFYPLLHVLAFSSKQIAKFKDFLVKYQLPKGAFPLKATIPLFFTMKAAFKLQNLSFDTSDFAPNLFTIDEEYMKMKQHQYQLSKNHRKVGKVSATSATLREIYKLCKKDEDQEEDEEDEDSESLERAHQQFNSMLKKGQNQQDEVLLDISSLHSEYDSIELNEKMMTDDSFKLNSHAFSKVQTLNSINARHNGDDETIIIPNPNVKLIIDYELQMKNQQKKYKDTRKQAHFVVGSGGENIFDSRSMEIRPQVNSTVNKKAIGVQGRQQQQQVVHHYNPGLSQVSQVSNDSVKTLKKNFQPRNMKNLKNMIKYSSNQSVLEEGTQQQSDQQVSLNSNTPLASTADTSIIANKITSFFQAHAGQMSNSQNQWFKLLIKNKNSLLPGGGYLQTIESEEVVGTDGNDNSSQDSYNQTLVNCNMVTQSNYENSSQRSLKKSGNKSKSNLISSNSNQKQSLNVSNSQLPFEIPIPFNNRNNSYLHNFSRDDKKENSTNSRLQAYLNQQTQMSQNNQQSFVIQQMTPQKEKPMMSQSNQNIHITPSKVLNGISMGSLKKQFEQQKGSISNSANNSSKQGGANEALNKPFLPPKVGHKRQSSYGEGGSSGNIIATYFQNPSAPIPQTNTGSGGIFQKIFGQSFSRSSATYGATQVKDSSVDINPFVTSGSESNNFQYDKALSQSLKTNIQTPTLQRDNINGNSKSMNVMRNILLNNGEGSNSSAHLKRAK